MRTLLAVVVMMGLTVLSAPNSRATRLALLAQDTSASSAVDVLTAELSKREDVQLVERSEIDKVYREQALSAGNKDYLKLGRILGADGLLVLDQTKDGTNEVLNTRLVAVKPGVVLSAEKYPWPIKDLAGWSSVLSKKLCPLIPKLQVLAKDAIPVSVVNLRSAVPSADAAETERQLKLLTIQRLSREPQLFVLERQQMQSLAEEKVLNVDESAFWNGSYLLEGVVDQNGYSKDTITINARVTPKGAQTISFDVSGPRTNLAEVVNSLVIKLAGLLKVTPSATAWNATDEARQYFEEAQWAFKWGMNSEAQEASESAWGLGKKDLDCAVLRVRSYARDVGWIAHGDDVWTTLFTKQDLANHQCVKVTEKFIAPGHSDVSLVWLTTVPDVQTINKAIRALELYESFSRVSPDATLRVAVRKPWIEWHNTEWYTAGLAVLVGASELLEDFNVAKVTPSTEVREKLSHIRELARSIASHICADPKVRETYFVGDELVYHDFGHNPLSEDSVFDCEVKWGAYWQEAPEDCLTMYRELLSSPVFCEVHKNFWSRKGPWRLVAWNQAAQRRIPALWNNFLAELNASTNVLWRMECQALLNADATTEDQARIAEARWWQIVRSHHDELVGNNVELFYREWCFEQNAETEQMDGEYYSGTIRSKQMAAAFLKQKQYLSDLTPYDWDQFNEIFRLQKYSKEQAAELKPLVSAYKSNLLAHVPPGNQKVNGIPIATKITEDVQWIELKLEHTIDTVLGIAPVPAIKKDAIASRPKTSFAPVPFAAASNSAAIVVTITPPKPLTNIIEATKFLPIPIAGLSSGEITRTIVTGHHYVEGKLVLDLRCNAYSDSRDTGTHSDLFSAVAILDPETEEWQVVRRPDIDFTQQNYGYYRTTLCRGELFVSDGGKVSKYDFSKKSWRALDLAELDNCQLFSVNGRLYATVANMIAEIVDGGERLKVLASNRRQPAISPLDRKQLLNATLFAGPDGSTWAEIDHNILAREGDEWRTICPTPCPPAMISEDEVQFSVDSFFGPIELWRLQTATGKIEFWLGKGYQQDFVAMTPNDGDNTAPKWRAPRGFSHLSAAGRGKDLFLLTDHSKAEPIRDEGNVILGYNVVPQDGYHAELICLSDHLAFPQRTGLRFKVNGAALPVTGTNHPQYTVGVERSSPWLLFSRNRLICGQETPKGGSGGYIGRPSWEFPRAGVWVVPTSIIDNEIAHQRQIQQQEHALSASRAEMRAMPVGEKFDLNHDGQIDLNEREQALDNVEFLKSNLSSIDTNLNGWLDASELGFFDPLQTKILGQKQQTAIALTQRLLAAKLIEQFGDASVAGLHSDGYEAMYVTTRHPRGTFDYHARFLQADANRDGVLDLDEVERILWEYTAAGLVPRDWQRRGGRPPANPLQNFKAAVEAYWKDSGGTSNTSNATR